MRPPGLLLLNGRKPSKTHPLGRPATPFMVKLPPCACGGGFGLEVRTIGEPPQDVDIPRATKSLWGPLFHWRCWKCEKPVLAHFTLLARCRHGELPRPSRNRTKTPNHANQPKLRLMSDSRFFGMATIGKSEERLKKDISEIL